jgi:hypothetical protein
MMSLTVEMWATWWNNVMGDDEDSEERWEKRNGAASVNVEQMEVLLYQLWSCKDENCSSRILKEMETK